MEVKENVIWQNGNEWNRDVAKLKYGKMGMGSVIEYGKMKIR